MNNNVYIVIPANAGILSVGMMIGRRARSAYTAVKHNIPAFAGMTMAVILLSACTASDAYLAGLPKQNTVMPDSTSHVVSFKRGELHLSRDERARLADFMGGLPSDAVKEIVLESDLNAKGASDRNKHLTRLIRLGGYRSASIATFETGDMAPLTAPSNDKSGHQTRVMVHYLKVLPPQGCPDWRHGAGWGNPDNLPSSNFGCAAMVNLGQMVSDPADLVGRTSVRMGGSDNTALAAGRYTAGYAQQGNNTGNE